MLDTTMDAGERATEANGVTEAWISFETELARGFGLIRLKTARSGISCAQIH